MFEAVNDDDFTPEELQQVLDEFERDGLVWKGRDGRYRLCPNVDVMRTGDETVFVRLRGRPN